MIQPPQRLRPRNQRGAATVKIAIVLPLLLLFVFGVVDFGLMLKAQLTTTSAAREGARAQVHGQDAQGRVHQVSQELDGPVTATVTPCTDGRVTVATAYDYSFVTPLAAIAPLFDSSRDSTITLTGSAVMPCGEGEPDAWGGP